MRDVFFIDSAEDFLRAVEAVEKGQIALPKFRGWPHFHVRVHGDRYKSTLTPKLMHGFIEFQEQMLRTYAEIRYGTASLQKVGSSEKDELELVFQITEGSTDGQGGLQEAINKILSALPMNKMSGGQVAALLIIVVLSFAGYKVFSEWSQVDLEKAKLTNASKANDTQAALVGKLAEALAQKDTPREALVAKERATEGYRAIVSGAPDASSIDIQADRYNADELDKIRAHENEPKVRVERREELYIEMVKRHPEYLSLTLRVPGQSYTFPGRVDLSRFDQGKINQIFDALRDAAPIRIFHHSSENRQRILRTDVLAVDDVSKPSPTAPPADQ